MKNKIVYILLFVFLFVLTSCSTTTFSKYTQDINKKLTLNVAKPRYTIAFDKNSSTATGATASVSCVYGTSCNLTENGFENNGYTFKNWNTKADGSGDSYTTSVLNLSAINNNTVTLYAQWESNVYHITLNSSNATTHGTTDAYYEYNKTRTVGTTLCYYYTTDELTTCLSNGYNITIPTKTGYTFKGYYTEAAGAGTQYVNASGSFINNVYKTVGDKELFAHFTANTYTVTVNADGGIIPTTTGWTIASGSHTATKTLTYDSAYGTLPVPTKEGYDFDGWYLGDDEITSSSILNRTSNHTLTAKWTEKTNVAYTVNHYTHNLGNDTYTLDSTDNLSGKTNATVTINNLKKTIAGYTYEEGYTTGDTTKPDTEAETTTTILADGSRVINLYYRPNYLYVNYHVNGGTLASHHGERITLVGDIAAIDGKIDILRGVYGSRVGGVTLSTYAIDSTGLHNYNNSSGINITRPGYIAKSGAEWCDKANGTGTEYSHAYGKYKAIDMATAAGEDLSLGDKSITLYVNWEPVDYTITYNLDGGNISGEATTYNIESNAITLPTPTKEGYTFAGWTGSNGNTPQTTVTIPTGSTGNKTYTANWTANAYNITYELNNGTATNPNTYTTDTETFTLNNPVRSGYTFDGWTGSNGETPQTTVTIDNGSMGDKSYTANWSKEASKLSITLSETSYTYDGTAKTPTVTVKDGTVTLVEGTDYEITYSDNTNAGTASVIITMKDAYNSATKATYTGSTTKTFTINKKEVTVTAVNKSMTYGDSAPTYTNTVSGVITGETAYTGTVAYTVKNSSNTTVTISKTSPVGTYTITPSGLTATSNYTIKYVSGTLTISAATPTINHTAKTNMVYNGSAQTANTATVTLKNSETYSGTITYTYYANSSCTTKVTVANSGASAAGAAPVNAGNYYVQASIAANGNYAAAKGTCRAHNIAKRPVTYEASAQAKSYDGTPLNAANTCSLISGTLVSGHAATCTATGSQTEVGSSTKTLTGVTIKSGSTDLSSNYEITKNNSTLTVTTAEPTVVLTAKTGLIYNGSAQAANNAIVTLKNNEEFTGTITYTYYSNSSCTTKVTVANSGASAAGGIPKNAGNYYVQASIVASGNYQAATSACVSHNIAKKEVTYTAKDQSKVFDGTALTADATCTLTSGTLVSGQTATCTNTGSQTNVGSSAKTLSSVVIKSGSTDVSSNYTITKVNGTLTVTEATFTGGSVTITGNNVVGEVLTASVSDTTPKGTYTYQWYRGTTAIDGATSSTYTPTSDDVGNTLKVVVTVSKDNYTPITLEDSTDTTNNKTEGTKIKVTIPTAANYCYTGLVYDATEQTLVKNPATGYTWTAASKVRIPAGSQNVTAALSTNYIWSDYSTANKNISCSIAARPITVKAKNQSKVYNGSALTADTTCDITSGSLVSGHTLTCTSTGSQTNVGSSTKTLSTTVIKSGSTNLSSNYAITKENGTLTVTTATPTISLTAKTGLVYNGLAQATNNATVTLVNNETYSGDITYTYYSNSSCTTKVTTTNSGASTAGGVPKYAGTWYVKATTAAFGNYATGASSCVAHTISKATPTITLSAAKGTIILGKNGTFNEQANLPGKFSVESSATSVATVTQASSDEIPADTNNLVTMTSVAAGTSTITVTFNPTDSVNYESITTSYALTVNHARVRFSASTNGGLITGTTSNYKDLYVKLNTNELYTTARGNTVGTIPTATREGYTFEGWYSAAAIAENKKVYDASGNITTNTISNYIKNGVWITTANRNVYAGFSKPANELTISLSDSTYTYDGTAKTPTVTVKDGDTTLTENTDYTVTYSDNTNAGVATITITMKGAYNSTTKAIYKGSTTKTFTITPKALTITADDKSRDYGSSTTQTYSYSVSGAISGESPVSGTATYKVTNSSGTQVTVNSSLAAGTYNIIPSGLSINSNYSATYVNGTLTVSKIAATCPTLTAYSKAYDGAEHSITVSGGSGGTIQYRTSATGTWSNDNPTRKDYGTTTVYVQVLGDDNHSTKDCGSKTLSVTKKAVTVTAEDKTRNYGDTTTQTYSYTVAGAIGSETAVSGTASYTVKNSGGTTVTVNSSLAAGSYTITPSGLTAGSNYSITYADGTLTVSNATPTVSLTAKTGLVYNGLAQATNNATVTLVNNETYSGDVTYTYYSNSGCTTKVTTTNSGASAAGGVPVNAGTWYVKASIESSGNYEAASSACVTHKIDKKSVTYTAKNQSKVYDGTALNADSTCTLTSGSLVSGQTATCTNNGSQKDAGSSAKTLSSVVIKSGSTDVSSNYTITKVNGTLTVNPKELTINAVNKTMTYGSTPPTFTYTISGAISGETPVSQEGIYTVKNGSTVVTVDSNLPVGSYTIIPSDFTISSNYTPKYTNGTLTVSKAQARVIPGSISIGTNGIVTWSGENATGYMISIDGTNWTSIEENTKSGYNYLSTITASAGERIIYIKAVNTDTENFENQETAETASVTVVTLTTNVNNSAYGQVSATTTRVISGLTYSTTTNRLLLKSGSTTLKTITASTYNGAGSTTTFDNWSSDSGTITQNTTITANFSRTANTLTITANANGGSIPSTTNWTGTGNTSTKSVTYGSTYGNLPTPTRTGYTFNGWLLHPKETLPAEYTQLDYIQTTGNQYIDTLYYPTPNTSVVADYQFTATTAQQRLFGISTTASLANTLSYDIYISGGYVYSWAFKDNIGNWSWTSVKADTNRHIINFDGYNKKLLVDGVQSTLGSATNSSPNTLPLFARHNPVNNEYTGYAKVKLYSLKIYESGTLVRNMVPVLNTTTNKAGLYDTITGTFYTNDVGSNLSYGNINYITSTTNVTTPVDHNIYADWSLENYTVSYDLDGGVVDTPNPTSYNINTPTFTLNNPTKSGFTFNGWTGSNGNTPQTNVSIAQGTTGAKNFIANYSENCAILTYNANGHGTAPESQSMCYTTATNAAPAITAENYTFINWNTSANGSGISYNAGDQVKAANANSTINSLYAQWDYSATPVITLVDFNTFSYSGAGAAAYYISKSSTPPTAGVAQSGFAIDTWTTATSTDDLTLANGEVYYVFIEDANSDNAKVSTQSASINVRRVRRSVGTGTSLTVKQESSSGETATFASNYTYVLHGSTLYFNATAKAGYKNPLLYKDVLTTPITNDATYVITANATFSSRATANVFEIEFIPNGATAGTMANQSFTYGVAQTLTPNAFSKSYLITYDANGGTISGSTTQNVNYTFAGWKKNNDGTLIPDETSTKNVTTIDEQIVSYYAQWYGANNTIDALMTATLKSAPTRTGGTFAGWKLTADDLVPEGEEIPDEIYEASSDIEVESNKTLTAIWEDRTAPSAPSATISNCNASSVGFCTTIPTITVTEGADSGTGVLKTTYQIDDGLETDIVNNGTFTINNEGTHTITVRTYDKAHDVPNASWTPIDENNVSEYTINVVVKTKSNLLLDFNIMDKLYNWNFTNENAFSIGFDSTDYVNNIEFTNKSAWELIYIPINTTVGKTYNLKVDYQNLDESTYTIASGHSGIEIKALSKVTPGSDNSENTIATTYFDPTLVGEVGTATLSFTATENKTYIALDFGVITSPTAQIRIGNFRFNDLLNIGDAITGVPSFIFAQTKSKGLPAGYIEKEYIESNGLQYIDTGIKASSNITYEISFSTVNGFNTTNHGAIFGARVSSTSSEIQLSTWSPSGYPYGVYRYANNNQYSAQLMGNARITVKHDTSNNYYVDGVKKANIPVSSFSSNYNIYLFALNQAGAALAPSSTKLYSFKLYESGTLVRDFVPCVDESTGKAGLYDLVSGAFFGNAGSGDFFTNPEKVNLPTGYRQVEYIESTGTQYINTNYTPTNTMGVYAELSSEDTNTDLIFFGSKGSSNNRFWFGNNGNKYYTGWNTNSYEGTANIKERRNIIQMNYLNSRQAKVNDYVTISSLGTLASNSTPLTIFAGNNNGTVSYKSLIRLYKLKISNNDSIIHDYVPCVDELTGKAGLYDLITNTFLGNSGTGDFEYLELPQDDYTFKGWFTQREGGVAMQNNSTISEDDETYYAQADSNKYYNLTFDSNYVNGDIYGNNILNLNKYLSNGTNITSADLEYNQNAKEQLQVNLTMGNGSTNGAYFDTTGLTLTANSVYTWSVYLKADSNKTLTVGSEQNGTTEVEVTTEWQRFTFTFTANSNASKNFIFYLANGSTWTSGEKLYIHSLEIGKVNNVYGGAVWNDNESIKLDGSNDYVRLAVNNISTGTIETTFSADGYNTSNNSHVLSSTEYGGFAIELQTSTGNIKYQVHVGDAYQGLTSSKTATKGSKFTAAVTYDGNVLKCYLNGNLIYTKNVVGTITAVSVPWTIGANPNASGNDSGYYFNGKIYTARGYNTILTSNQLKKNFEVTNGYSDEGYETNGMFINFSPKENIGDAIAKDVTLKKSGSAIGTLPELNRIGYTFDGWFTEPVGGIKVEETSIMPSKNQKIYAHWTSVSSTRDSVKVKFYRNKSSSDNETKTVAYLTGLSGQKFTTNSWTNTGYELKGWSTVRGSTNIDYDPTQTVSDSWISGHNGEIVNLYAVWEPKTYTITLNASDWDTPGTTKIYEVYNDYFYLDSAKTKKMTTSSNHITVPSGTSKITFNGNGGTSSTASKNVTYSYTGYYTSASGGTKILDANGYLVSGITATQFSANTTLYPHYKYASITLPSASRTGYTFSGWYTSASGGTKIGGSGATYTPSGSTTLYAHWSVKSYSITLYENAPSGSNRSETKSLNYNASLPSTTKWGDYSYDKNGSRWIFDGWYTKASGGTKKTKVDGTTKLYAHWR